MMLFHLLICQLLLSSYPGYRDPDDNVDLFDLLEKPFDENALTYAIHEELTVHEVITLVNRLVDYCCSTRSETVCAKVTTGLFICSF